MSKETRRVKGTDIAQLLSSVDPVDSSRFDPSSRKGEAMLERVLTTVREPERAGQRMRARRGRRLAIAAVTLVGLAVIGVGTAFATGAFDQGSEKVAEVAKVVASGDLRVQQVGDDVSAMDDVANVVAVAATADGNAGVVEGLKDGVPVYLITIQGGSGLSFLPISERLEKSGGLDVLRGLRGSAAGVVDALDLAGIASPETAAIKLVSSSGAERSVELAEMSSGAKAFATSVDPKEFPVASVVAYSADGKEIVREQIPASALAAPGQEGLGIKP